MLKYATNHIFNIQYYAKINCITWLIDIDIKGTTLIINKEKLLIVFSSIFINFNFYFKIKNF